MILNPYESPYANEGTSNLTTGTSFILKHKSYDAYIGPKNGGGTPVANGEALVWYNLGP